MTNQIQKSRTSEFIYLAFYEHRVHYDRYYVDGTWFNQKGIIGAFANKQDANTSARDYWNENCLEEPDSEQEETKQGDEQVLADLPEKGELFSCKRGLLFREKAHWRVREMYDCDNDSQEFAVYVKEKEVE